MLLEQKLEEDLITEFEKLNLENCQIISSRQKNKTEDESYTSLLAVVVGTRSHDAFSLSPITIQVSLSLVSRIEDDTDGTNHCSNVEKILNLLSKWHFRSELISCLDSEKFHAGELRLNGGSGTVFDSTNRVYSDTISFTIRGAEIFTEE